MSEPDSCSEQCICLSRRRKKKDDHKESTDREELRQQRQADNFLFQDKKVEGKSLMFLSLKKEMAVIKSFNLFLDQPQIQEEKRFQEEEARG